MTAEPPDAEPSPVLRITPPLITSPSDRSARTAASPTNVNTPVASLIHSAATRFNAASSPTDHPPRLIHVPNNSGASSMFATTVTSPTLTTASPADPPPRNSPADKTNRPASKSNTAPPGARTDAPSNRTTPSPVDDQLAPSPTSIAVAPSTRRTSDPASTSNRVSPTDPRAISRSPPAAANAPPSLVRPAVIRNVPPVDSIRPRLINRSMPPSITTSPIPTITPELSLVIRFVPPVPRFNVPSPSNTIRPTLINPSPETTGEPPPPPGSSPPASSSTSNVISPRLTTGRDADVTNRPASTRKNPGSNSNDAPAEADWVPPRKPAPNPSVPPPPPV